MKGISKLIQGTSVAALALLFSAGAFAQTTPPAITAFSQEATVPYANIDAAGTVQIPENIIASIAGGALEIRQAIALQTDGRLRVRHLLVAKDAPNPTPAGTENAVIEDYLVTVSETLRSSDPASVTYIGTIASENAVSPFGRQRGLPFIFSFGYDSSTPVKFSSLTLVVPGRLTTFVASSTGTLTFASTGPGTDPGTGENKPPVVTLAATNISAVTSEVLLDASASTDPEKEALTFSWKVVQGSANIRNADTAKPTVQLSSNFGSYVFEVTVKDAKGASATAQVTVTYVGRF